MPIEYCSSSTLKEVYTAVVGLPDAPDPLEAAILRRQFQRTWSPHTLAANQVLVQGPATEGDGLAEVPPRWFEQLTWENGAWTGRWGHRTLGLHRLITKGKYETFSSTMKPTLLEWLEAGERAYDFLGQAPPVASVVFGYVNVFELELDDGDLSDWFRFNFAVDITGAETGLVELAVGAKVARPDKAARAAINLVAKQQDHHVEVVVHTFAERDATDGTTFAEQNQLLDEIEQAKTVAKDTFFSFTTEQTLELMGASHGPQATAQPD